MNTIWPYDHLVQNSSIYKELCGALGRELHITEPSPDSVLSFFPSTNLDLTPNQKMFGDNFSYKTIQPFKNLSMLQYHWREHQSSMWNHLKALGLGLQLRQNPPLDMAMLTSQRAICQQRWSYEHYTWFLEISAIRVSPGICWNFVHLHSSLI